MNRMWWNNLARSLWAFRCREKGDCFPSSKVAHCKRSLLWKALTDPFLVPEQWKNQKRKIARCGSI